MRDTIYRDDAIKEIKAEACLGIVECQESWLIDRIKAIPSADRPQGEWTYHMDEVGNVKTVSCALCGGWVDTTIPEQTAEFAYCPYCGARMKGADDEKTN